MTSRKKSYVPGERPLKFRTSSLLTVVVGTPPQQEQFSVHEGIICARSEFFRRAMRGNWAESEERLIKLPEDDPEIFELYINIVYTGQAPTVLLGDAKTLDAIDPEYQKLCELYVLCEKLDDTAAKGVVMLAILAASRIPAIDDNCYVPDRASVDIIYAGTPAESLARKLMADMWCGVVADNFIEDAELLPKDFVIQLGHALLMKRDG